ncbi:uncharacterized protein HD556DRAFT_1438236 [Suillus plorans]|uniref:Uncharacterized protein n=1 Tax=Suillus plorans TaxID=116603 RepID=A0A9P7DT18_9AGAM|nr:uncharacterized protein HD556DRAFT_1438236 [Suillus plorans]KAG1802188.1 hypothetical protein HD556DRAFT_1438236 [Suillus plorans]
MTSTTLRETTSPVPTATTGTDTEDNSPSPDSPDTAYNIPLSEITSAFTSHFSTLVLNTPASQMQDILNDEETVDEFIVPTIEITSPEVQQKPTSPATHEADSLLEDFPFSDLDFSFLSMPNSPSSTFSHVEPHDPAPETHVQSSWIAVPDSVDQSTSINSSIPTLSPVSTCESIPTSDCYSRTNDQTTVDLYAVSENENPNHASESTPFITQVILYGPGAKTTCFHVNVDDRAMVNIMDLKAFSKASQNLKKLTQSARIL